MKLQHVSVFTQSKLQYSILEHIYIGYIRLLWKSNIICIGCAKMKRINFLFCEGIGLSSKEK